MSLSRVVNRASLTASLLFIGSTAFGDTRALMLHHVHTDEKLTITYKKDGQYDNAALKKINWIMRDWRKNEAITMDPKAIDLLWEVYHGIGAKGPIQIIGGYRTPSTNEMLRTRSLRSGVALHSLHMLGKAIDFYIPSVSLAKVRETAMRLQGGGVGYYPTSGSPFVHLDVGNVSAWPRLTREQLVKLFRDGRTTHLPADGTPLVGYELARADIEHGAHHRAVAESTKRSSQASVSSRDINGDSVTSPETNAVPRGVSARPAPAAPAAVVAAGYYRGYGHGGCHTYVPYGWTWHRASRC
jgi:uncharacterized protein YcbK (DUF882 family)